MAAWAVTACEELISNDTPRMGDIMIGERGSGWAAGWAVSRSRHGGVRMDDAIGVRDALIGVVLGPTASWAVHSS